MEEYIVAVNRETQYPHTIPPKHSLKSPLAPNLTRGRTMNEVVESLETREGISERVSGLSRGSRMETRVIDAKSRIESEGRGI